MQPPKGLIRPCKYVLRKNFWLPQPYQFNGWWSSDFWIIAVLISFLFLRIQLSPSRLVSLSCKTLLRWWLHLRKRYRGLKCFRGHFWHRGAAAVRGRACWENFLCHMLTKECIAFLRPGRKVGWTKGCPGFFTTTQLWDYVKKHYIYIYIYYVCYVYIYIFFFSFEFPSLNSQHLMKSKRVFCD